MKKEMENRVAVVTGGAQGIGLAVCQALAVAGADLVVADLNGDGARTAADKIDGRRTLAVHVDVSSEPSVTQLIHSTLAHFGRIDIVVHCAGICKRVPILELETAEWDRMMAVNLRGTFLMGREAFRAMKPVGKGRIINLASVAGKLSGVAAGAHYSASKAGVISFTKSLATQAAPYKINVNAVCPGPTVTEMTQSWGDEMNQAYAARIPWQEYGQPQDVADAVAFLASDRARYITGEILDVNGGLFMD